MIYTDDAGGLVENETQQAGGNPGSKPGLNDQAKRRLSTHLRALYQSVLDQPVPDRFRDLITRLEDSPRDDPLR